MEFIHYKQNLVLDHRKYVQNIDSKPNGFWFSINDAWKEFAHTAFDWPIQPIENYPDLLSPNKIEIINKNKVLLVDSLEKLDKINSLYGVDDFIDWVEFAKDFKGIVFVKEVIHKYEWSRKLDIPSGCVWDTTIIKII